MSCQAPQDSCISEDMPLGKVLKSVKELVAVNTNKKVQLYYNSKQRIQQEIEVPYHGADLSMTIDIRQSYAILRKKTAKRSRKMFASFSRSCVIVCNCGLNGLETLNSAHVKVVFWRNALATNPHLFGSGRSLVSAALRRRMR